MYKVMIVDDMEIVRRELKRMPIWGSKSGFEITAEARNGQEALELLKLDEVDLVITDIKMPKIDGLELLQKINEKHLSKFVVLLSDYTEFSFARQGLILGAFDYLAKPADVDELSKLLGRVGENLESRKMESERLKVMEEKLVEKVVSFFPTTDVDQLIVQILAGDEAVLDLVDRIADFSDTSLGGDLIRMEFLLKNILNVIMNRIMEVNPWLAGFMDQNGIMNTGSLRLSTVQDMKRIFSERVEELQRLINKLQCGMTDNEVVKRMCNCVLENSDGEMSLKMVAEKLYMNRTYLSEMFRQKTGKQFVEYLTMVKMERAKILLGDYRLKTYEIAIRLGFKDIEYFSRLFKRYTGIPPMEFRQMNAV